MSQAMGHWAKHVHKLVVQLADQIGLSGQPNYKGSSEIARAVDELLIAEPRMVYAMAVEYLQEQVASFRRGETLSKEQAAVLREQKEVIRPQQEWWRSAEGDALRARWAERDRVYREKWETLTTVVVDKAHAEVVLDFSTSLREARFAMPDGSEVTWGEATVEQHQERLEMLMRNVVGNLDAARRHRAAIKALTETGVETLDALMTLEMAR